MSSVLAMLLLIALVLLVWGLISPRGLSKVVKKPLSRKSAVIGIGALAVVLFVLVGVTAPPSTKTNIADKTKAKEVLAIDPQEGQQHEKIPTITTETITETEAIPFEKQTVNSASLAKGTTKITTTGVDGVKTRTYEVTYKDGIETDKKLVKEEVTTQPVTEVTTVGTKVVVTAPAPVETPSCDPNYSGCVPIASDVDCSGGSGNGPAYTSGPVQVIGTDIYKLDADHDGVGCE